MSHLVVRTGKHKGKRLVIPDGGVLIGRDDDCQLRLASNEVSRHHCSLEATPKGIVVRDRGSRNGTYVNDAPITDQVLLRPGDVLRVGPMEFVVPGRKSAKSGAPAGEKPASDADIVAWLSEESATATDADVPGDTTIVKDRSASQVELPPKTKEPAPKTPKFESIAEEAADIIRRYWDEKRSRSDEG
jgi:hypothetical protein